MQVALYLRNGHLYLVKANTQIPLFDYALNQIDAEARDREEQLVKQMMEKEGITEELKRQDNMEWTRRMNTLCHDAEEMILTEMIYTKG